MGFRMPRVSLPDRISDALSLSEKLSNAINKLPASIRESVAQLVLETIQKRKGPGRPPGRKARKRRAARRRKGAGKKARAPKTKPVEESKAG